MHAGGAGDFKSRGECALAEEGLVTRVITGHIGSSPRMMKAVQDNKVACYFWPLGSMVQWYSEVARQSPGSFDQDGPRYLR